jgi:hypothetical protein
MAKNSFLIRVKMYVYYLYYFSGFVICGKNYIFLIRAQCTYTYEFRLKQPKLGRSFIATFLTTCAYELSLVGRALQVPEQSFFQNRPQEPILPGLPDFSGHNIPNRWKIYKIATKLQTRHKIHQLATEYPNLFHSKALQNLPKLGFLV